MGLRRPILLQVTAALIIVQVSLGRVIPVQDVAPDETLSIVIMEGVSHEENLREPLEKISVAHEVGSAGMRMALVPDPEMLANMKKRDTTQNVQADINEATPEDDISESSQSMNGVSHLKSEIHLNSEDLKKQVVTDMSIVIKFNSEHDTTTATLDNGGEEDTPAVKNVSPTVSIIAVNEASTLGEVSTTDISHLADMRAALEDMRYTMTAISNDMFRSGDPEAKGIVVQSSRVAAPGHDHPLDGDGILASAATMGSESALDATPSLLRHREPDAVSQFSRKLVANDELVRIVSHMAPATENPATDPIRVDFVIANVGTRTSTPVEEATPETVTLLPATFRAANILDFVMETSFSTPSLDESTETSTLEHYTTALLSEEETTAVPEAALETATVVSSAPSTAPVNQSTALPQFTETTEHSSTLPVMETTTTLAQGIIPSTTSVMTPSPKEPGTSPVSVATESSTDDVTNSPVAFSKNGPTVRHRNSNLYLPALVQILSHLVDELEIKESSAAKINTLTSNPHFSETTSYTTVHDTTPQPAATDKSTEDSQEDFEENMPIIQHNVPVISEETVPMMMMFNMIPSGAPEMMIADSTMGEGLLLGNMEHNSEEDVAERTTDDSSEKFEISLPAEVSPGPSIKPHVSISERTEFINNPTLCAWLKDPVDLESSTGYLLSELAEKDDMDQGDDNSSESLESAEDLSRFQYEAFKDVGSLFLKGGEGLPEKPLTGVPPTKSIVTLVKLRFALISDLRRQGLNNFQGFSEHVLQDLVATSTLTGADQFGVVLSEVLSGGEIKAPSVRKRAEAVLVEIQKTDSVLNKSLKGIMALKYVRNY